MLDRASIERELGALVPEPGKGRTAPPARPPETESAPAGPAEPPPEPSVRLSMEDIERLAVKPPDRASSVPAAGPQDDAPVPAEEARASTPPDAAALGNTMKALFDASVAAAAESDAAAAESRSSVGDAPGSEARAPGAAAEADKASEAAGAIAGREQSAAAGQRAAEGAGERSDVSGKTLWLAGILGLSVIAAVWIAVNGWPLAGPGERDDDSLSSARGVSGPDAVSRSGAEPGEAADERDEVESGSKKKRRARSKRRRKAREARAGISDRGEARAVDRDSGDGEGIAPEEQSGVAEASPGDPAAATEEEAPEGAAAPPFDSAAATPPEQGAPAAAAGAEVERPIDPWAEQPAIAQPSQVPDRESVRQAMEKVLPEVRQCAAGKRGVAEVTMTVKNTGRVTHAVVGGDFAGTAEGSCIARAVRKTRLPPFLRPSFTLVYPFAL